MKSIVTCSGHRALALILLALASAPLAMAQTNTKLGSSAGIALTTGNNNTAIGSGALKTDIAGSFNTAVGSSAIRNTTAANNVGVGYQALYRDTTGASNVGVGNKALSQNTTGGGNIALGNLAGYAITGSNNIAIGNLGVAGESSVIRIGTPETHGNTILSGNVSVGSGTFSSFPLQVTGSSNNYGIAHTDGTRTLATYLDSTGGWLGTTSNNPLHFYANGGGASVTLATSGNLGIGITTPSAKLHVNGSVAIEGSIRVPSAGINTTKSVYIHQTTAANIVTYQTILSNPLCNGDPNAIIFAINHYNPNGAPVLNKLHTSPIGIFYNTSAGKWYLFNQDFAAMQQDLYFNIMIVKP